MEILTAPRLNQNQVLIVKPVIKVKIHIVGDQKEVFIFDKPIKKNEYVIPSRKIERVIKPLVKFIPKSELEVKKPILTAREAFDIKIKEKISKSLQC